MEHDDYATLFRELYIPAYSVAFRVLRNAQEAEDAAAEALARTAASWKRLRGLSYQRAWVLRVTANVAIDMLRKRRSVAAPVPSSPAAEPESRLLLAAALRKLPRRQREVLVLRYLADMTEEQVATHLTISRNTVKQHCTRGLVRLRELMGSPSEEVSLAC